MDEIIRRLRSRDSQSMKALKESLPVKGITEAEDDPVEEEEETEVEAMPPEEDIDKEEETPAEEEEEPKESSEKVESEHINPLDNEYAINFELGQKVALTYSNGKKSNLVGTIEGYDTEGFYRVKWSNNKITSGFTDLALSELVEIKSTSTDECVCGNKEFVTESDKLVCDKCGRIFNENMSNLKKEEVDISESYAVISDDESDRRDITDDTLKGALKKAINAAINSGGYEFNVLNNKDRIFYVRASWRGDHLTLKTSVGDIMLTPKKVGSKYEVSDDIVDKIIEYEFRSVNESKAYDVRYTYDGDSLSDYESNIIVVADSPEEAIKRAKHEVPEGRFFRVDRTYDSVKAYKSLYPNSNRKISEDADLELIEKDKTNPVKKIIRAEQHPVSTATKPSIEESIRSAFSKKKSIKESEESTDVFTKLHTLDNEFWTRRSEMLEDIKALGYEVLEDNDEYILVAVEDDEGDEHQLQIPMGGTARTLTLDFKRAAKV